jgi:hypothetical protein
VSCPDTYPDIISVRSFISKQFPTLLAIREIIADAMFLTLKNHTGTSTEDEFQYLIAKIVI